MNKFTQQTTWINLTNIILSKKKKKRKPQCHNSTHSGPIVLLDLSAGSIVRFHGASLTQDFPTFRHYVFRKSE